LRGGNNDGRDNGPRRWHVLGWIGDESWFGWAYVLESQKIHGDPTFAFEVKTAAADTFQLPLDIKSRR